MNISSRCEYACRAVLELALHERAGEPQTAEFIAGRRHIPEKFLVHILLQLKRAGIIRSVRGAHGGYVLARPAEEVTLLDVMEAVDGPVLKPLPVEDSGAVEMGVTWNAVASEMEAALRARTFATIADAAAQTGMYYI